MLATMTGIPVLEKGFSIYKPLLGGETLKLNVPAYIIKLPGFDVIVAMR